jgi:DNA polymerase IV
VIGAAEAKTFLARQSVRLIWGVGKAFEEKLQRDGIHLIGQLQSMERNDLMARYGGMGSRLYHLSRGEDVRNVEADEESKSISAETTFNTDISNAGELSAILWQLAERVARRAKKDEMEGHTVTLKLKTPDFKSRTRSTSLHDATQLAHRIYDVAHPLLLKEANGQSFRLIGVGISNLQPATHEDYETLDAKQTVLTKAELAIDAIRQKFGKDAVEKGLVLRKKDE